MLSDIQDTFKHERDQFNEDFKLRIHRTLSWLQRAEQAQLEQDLDSQFIFLWIGFNAVYAKDLGAGIRSVDKGLFVQFLHRICYLLSGSGAENLSLGLEYIFRQYPCVAR